MTMFLPNSFLSSHSVAVIGLIKVLAQEEKVPQMKLTMCFHLQHITPACGRISFANA